MKANDLVGGGLKPYPAWLIHVNSSKSNDVADLADSISSVIDQMASKGAWAVDADLARVRVSEANEYHLVAVLRTLFTRRGALENWSVLERKTYEELEKRGLSAAKIMRGLDKA